MLCLSALYRDIRGGWRIPNMDHSSSSSSSSSSTGWGEGTNYNNNNNNNNGSSSGNNAYYNNKDHAPFFPEDPVAAQTLFDSMGRYVLRDYDREPPFSDFLPGLAGIYGKPLYAFWVNRGQGIASFGVESKDYPLMEFLSANKAYQTTPLLGFRTFLQVHRTPRKQPTINKQQQQQQQQQHQRSFSRDNSSTMTTATTMGLKNMIVIEPFSPLTTNFDTSSSDSNLLPKRTLYAGTNELQLQEVDSNHAIETNVTYFILPEEDFGAFVRRTTITNIHPKDSMTISMLDGLTRMEPFGGKMDKLLKTIGRTLEGWMGVYFPYSDSITMPFYRLSTEPQDSASVKVLEEGHYVLSFVEGNGNHPTVLLPIAYDTDKVFGPDTTLLRPNELYSKSVSEIVHGAQNGLAKTSSAFAAGT